MREGPLDAAGYTWLADVYEALSRRGLDPRQVDELETWEAAALMGLHRDDDTNDGHRGGRGVSRPVTGIQVPQGMLAAAAAARGGEGP